MAKIEFTRTLQARTTTTGRQFLLTIPKEIVIDVLDADAGERVKLVVERGEVILRKG